MTDRTDLSKDGRDHNPGIGEQAGEGVGGIGGTLAGAAIGSIGGPIGSVIGGIAGALGGWWAGEKVGRAAEDFGDHEPYYREHYNTTQSSDVDWNDARAGYGLGHVAGRNPSYRGRGYDEVESDLRKGWKDRDRDFDRMRPYVRHGFDRTSKSDWSDR